MRNRKHIMNRRIAERAQAARDRQVLRCLALIRGF